MNWKDQLNKAIGAAKDFAESDTARDLAAKTRVTAQHLAQKAKAGALDAAETFVDAYSDPSALKVRYLNADLTVVSPSDGLEISRPRAGTLFVSDGRGNGLVIDAHARPALVVESVGTVNPVEEGTYELGAEEGVNRLVLKI